MADLQLPVITGNPLVDSHNISSSYAGNHYDCRRNQNFFRRQTEEKTNEIKHHYENLKTDLIDLSEDLTIKTNTVKGIPQWREEMELVPIEIDLHEDLKYRLKKGKLKKNENDLLEDIMTLQQEISTHNEKIVKFRKEIRPFVENKFKENDIIPSEEPDRGFYYDSEYIDLLNIQ